MWAARLHQPSRASSQPLVIERVPTPSPGKDEVLLRVLACGVCRTDLHVVEGDLRNRGRPRIPGHQIVGEVIAVGDGVDEPKVGRMAGVAWLHRTCQACAYCTDGRENLCDRSEFTGWSVDGGFAEFVVAPAAFTYALDSTLSPTAAAPLMCAGIIGYRALRLTGLAESGLAGKRLGIYGFGAAGHITLQIARKRGAEVYVATRDRSRHQRLATELGAAWVGGATDSPPEGLDAAIIFAPAGELVPGALEALKPGGVLVLGGITMSPIPTLDYSLIYHEKVIRSVTNNTRQDGREFLAEASRLAIEPHTRCYSLRQANEALADLKDDAIAGAAVIDMTAAS